MAAFPSPSYYTNEDITYTTATVVTVENISLYTPYTNSVVTFGQPRRIKSVVSISGQPTRIVSKDGEICQTLKEKIARDALIKSKESWYCPRALLAQSRVTSQRYISWKPYTSLSRTQLRSQKRKSRLHRA